MTKRALGSCHLPARPRILLPFLGLCLLAMPAPARAADCADVVRPFLNEIPGFQTARVVRTDEGTVAILARGGTQRVYLGVGLRTEGGDVRVFRELTDADGRVLGIPPDVNAAISRIRAGIRAAPDAAACAVEAASGSFEDSMRRTIARERPLARKELDELAAARGIHPSGGLVAFLWDSTRWPLTGDRLLFPIVFWVVPLAIAVLAWRRRRRTQRRS